MGWTRTNPPVQIQLPKRDAQILAKYEKRAKQFDEMIKICCCWIGYDVLLDFIPVVGKVISLCFSLSMYNLACQADLPRKLRRRMVYNISADFVLGVIPIAGIVLTALYRANTKNARLLRKYLYDRARLNQDPQEKETPIPKPKSSFAVAPPALPARRITTAGSPPPPPPPPRSKPHY